MSLARVPLFGQVGRSVTVNPEATKGAVFGVNLTYPDGTLVKASDFQSAATPTTPGSTVVVWELILDVPPNVQALASTSTTGLYTITGPGTSATRAILGVAGEIDVTDGDGVADDPEIGLADTAVTPGTYTNMTATVDAKGRVTAASSGSAGGILPIVTGEIASGQPVFVYGPDGSLVYGPVV